jgi:hypothetical protein
VREHRSEEHDIEAAVWKRETIGGRLLAAARVVGLVDNIRVMKAEGWRARRDGGLAPAHGLRVNFEAVVAGA